ncbi:MAG TPA: phage/plasmid primase, P4 family [Gemmata sp.]
MAENPIDNLLPKLVCVRPRGEGRSWSALCPGHADGANSLGIAVGRAESVLLKCYAGCPTADILRPLGLEMKDLFPGGRERKAPKNAGCTLARLGFEKRLPVEHLKAHGLRDERDGSKPVVKIPYRSTDGSVLFERQREGPTGGENVQPAGVKLALFGLWRIDEFRAGKRLILVEGETDTLTLWLHGYPALGIPGASALGSFDAKLLDGFTDLFVWQESDRAGSKMIAKLREKLAGRDWKVIRHDAAKDPNDLHAADPDKFRERFEAVLAAAAPPGEVPPAEGSREATGRTRYDLTDLGNARRLVDKHGHDLRFSHPQSQWFAWDGTRWAHDDTGEVTRRATDTVTGMFSEAAGLASAESRTKLVQHALKSQAARAIGAMVLLARSEPSIPVRPDDLDANPWLLNCPNGTVDLRTGEVREHRRGDLITQMAPVPFDPAARCPTWEGFLAKVFPASVESPDAGGHPGLIGYIQRLLGYGLTGDIREHTLPIFWGGGSNGKSTLIETVAAVFGQAYWCAAPEGMLMIRRGEAHPTELARLYRKRMVAATETEEGARLNVSLVKRLTGGDTVTARFMRQDFFEFAPTHKLIMATNDRPRIPSGGHGIWRRVALVPFNVKFWKAELGESGPELLRADGTLPGRLRAELPGILTWIVRGCLEWQRTGLNPPDEVRAATGEYRDQQNTIGQFLAEKTLTEKGAELTVKDLYSAYLVWCDGYGEQPIGKIRFNEAVSKENGWSRRKSEARATLNVDIWLNRKLSTSATTAASMADLDD